MAPPGGTLVLVVGPSGAGKDTLLAGARAALRGNNRFVFPRRVVTRPAVAAVEDHLSLSPAEFLEAEAGGAYALSWSAHGLHYGIPAAIRDELAAGRAVIANTSRAVIERARADFSPVGVILVDADPAIRARRLAGRGRESEEDIAQRLHREVTVPLEGATRIDNSGALEAGVQAFVGSLQQIAAI